MHSVFILALWALTAVLLSGVSVHAAEPRTCLVVGVSDGDTLTARCGEPDAYERMRVRVAGIDAPETGQPFGARAKDAMSDLVHGKLAHLKCHNTDRYGRSICDVWVAPASAPNGSMTLDAGLAMVSIGMAWWYRAYAGEQAPQARGQYEFAEQEARVRRAGLWAHRNPVAPWDWRKAKRAAAGQ